MERDIEFYMAEVALKAGRYNDFIESIRKACMTNPNLSVKERDIMWTGYQKAVWSLREELASLVWPNLDDDHLHVLFIEYQMKVEAELISICNGLIELINLHLLPAARDAEAIVFYKRMKGQQYFYMARELSGNKRRVFAAKSQKEYEEALQTAHTKLSSANVERLRLECSRCLLAYKIFNEEKRERASARAAASAAIEEDLLQCAENPSFTTLVELIRFSMGLNSHFFEDRIDVKKKIPMFHAQEGDEEPQRRRSI